MDEDLEWTFVLPFCRVVVVLLSRWNSVTGDEKCNSDDNNRAGVSVSRRLLRERWSHRSGYIRWQVRCLCNVNMACECKLAHSKALTRYTCVSLKLRGYTATDIASGPMWMMPTVRTTVP